MTSDAGFNSQDTDYARRIQEVLDELRQMQQTPQLVTSPAELEALERIFTQAIFSYLIVNKRIKCYFRENPSGYKSLTLEKSTA